MTATLDVEQVAGTLRLSIGLLVRRMKQVGPDGDLSMPESSALHRLSRSGPTTAAELARAEQISPQSMGATLAGLERRGLVGRRPDPGDGRRLVLSISAAGERALSNRRNARTQQLARALDRSCTPDELRALMDVAPLLERLAENL